MVAADTAPKCRIAFAFVPMAGHMNPSFPVARLLASMGHEVHYFTHEVVKKAVLSTGAVFHSIADYHSAVSDGRFAADSPIGIFSGLVEEHGLKPTGSNTGHAVLPFSMVSNVALELQLPGTLRFFDEVKPDVLFYDPMILCRDSLFAARLRGVPAVSLLTVAGPGGYADHMTAGVGEEAWVASMQGFAPHVEATRRLNATYDLGLAVVERPLMVLERAHKHLVTTSESLQDPMGPELAKAYAGQGAEFVYVGPLLEEDEGSLRLGMSKGADASGASVLAAARAARAAGRRVVLASMGTVLTSDLPSTGWTGRAQGANGEPRGLSGKELCQAAWGGIFDAFGAASEDEGPLVIVGLANRTDALDGLMAPPNALCPMGLPQVDLLRSGVDLFLTHGGQNSFMEAMSHGTPVVVCPGFGDQVVNAAKAEALGVGLQVPRPDAEPGRAAEAAAVYRATVRRTAAEVLGGDAFRRAAGRTSAELTEAGGVPRAVQAILEAASTGAPASRGGASGGA